MLSPLEFMISLLAIAFGLAVLISAVVADRTARGRHTVRARAFHLVGIACLAFGLAGVFTQNHHGIHWQGATKIFADDDGPTAKVRFAKKADRRRQRASAARANVRLAEVDSVTAEEEFSRQTRRTAAEDQTTMPEATTTEEPDTRADARPDSGIGSGVEIDYDARPAWVDQPDRDLEGVYQISVASGPCLHRRSTHKELSKQLKRATDEYILELIGSRRAPRWAGYGADEIRHRFVAPDHIFDEQIVSPSFGLMYQSHALLEFDQAFHDEVEESWRQVLARSQLIKVALGGGAILGVLVLLFGYFNADTATRGFYSGRLKFATAAAILALVATGFMIARSLPWLLP